MEGVKHEMRCQIIMNFYRKNWQQGKAYTVEYFKRLNVEKKQVYRAIARVETWQSHRQKQSAGAPRKLSNRQEKQVVKSMEDKNGSSLQATPLRDLKPHFAYLFTLNAFLLIIFTVAYTYLAFMKYLRPLHELFWWYGRVSYPYVASVPTRPYTRQNQSRAIGQEQWCKNCPKNAEKTNALPTDRRTDQPTDQPTDRLTQWGIKLRARD